MKVEVIEVVLYKIWFMQHGGKQGYSLYVERGWFPTQEQERIVVEANFLFLVDEKLRVV